MFENYTGVFFIAEVLIPEKCFLYLGSHVGLFYQFFQEFKKDIEFLIFGEVVEGKDRDSELGLYHKSEARIVNDSHIFQSSIYNP